MYVAVSFFLCTRTARMAHGRYDILEDTIEAMWIVDAMRYGDGGGEEGRSQSGSGTLDSGESRNEMLTVAAAVWLFMRNRVFQQIT